jgi:hypothetical protein
MTVIRSGLNFCVAQGRRSWISCTGWSAQHHFPPGGGPTHGEVRAEGGGARHDARGRGIGHLATIDSPMAAASPTQRDERRRNGMPPQYQYQFREVRFTADFAQRQSLGINGYLSATESPRYGLRFWPTSRRPGP